jgi:hypothetical protein
MTQSRRYGAVCPCVSGALLGTYLFRQDLDLASVKSSIANRVSAYAYCNLCS